MRMLLPLLPLAVVGCANDIGFHTQPSRDGAMHPRPLQAATQVDTIVQITQPEVDVLWVVDDSCSMSDDQNALAENFPIFFDFFEGSGLDYHIGVVSTDMTHTQRSGRLVTRQGYRWIDTDTSHAGGIFADMALLGTSGSATERGNDAAWTALETEYNGYNLGFLREKSGVHVVLISDEEDSSTLITPDELGAYLNGLRPDPDDVTFSSIALENSRYHTVTGFVGGIFRPIHEKDWTVVLHQLGLQAAGLKREYFLSRLPVPGTIEVSVVEGDITYAFEEEDDWEYNEVRNSIGFHEYVPNPHAEVILEYEVLSSHNE